MKSRLLLVMAALLASLGWLYFLVSVAPGSVASELRFPSNLDQLRSVAAALSGHASRHPAHGMLLFCSAYLFKQAFAVPGSVFMNALAGAVFGLPAGFALACALTATGATCCYGLAALGGREAAARFFPRRLDDFRRGLKENESQLSFYLLALRLFPVSPNWAINMSCGVLGVPVGKFFLTVLLGLMPYNYLCVQTGAFLASVSSMSDILSWTTMLQLTGMAAVALLPGLLMKKTKQS